MEELSYTSAFQLYYSVVHGCLTYCCVIWHRAGSNQEGLNDGRKKGREGGDTAQKLFAQHLSRKARWRLGRSGVGAGGQPQGLSLLAKLGLDGSHGARQPRGHDGLAWGQHSAPGRAHSQPSIYASHVALVMAHR